VWGIILGLFGVSSAMSEIALSTVSPSSGIKADSIKINNNEHQVGCYVAVIYGSNECLDRRLFWRDLRQHDSIIGDMPWIVMGDFNAFVKAMRLWVSLRFIDKVWRVLKKL